MKTKHDIESFIKFCKVVEDTFSKRILENLPLDKELLLRNQTLLETSLKTNKVVKISFYNRDYTIISGENQRIALNIIKWIMEEK